MQKKVYMCSAAQSNPAQQLGEQCMRIVSRGGLICACLSVWADLDFSQLVCAWEYLLILLLIKTTDY